MASAERSGGRRSCEDEDLAPIAASRVEHGVDSGSETASCHLRRSVVARPPGPRWRVFRAGGADVASPGLEVPGWGIGIGEQVKCRLAAAKSRGRRLGRQTGHRPNADRLAPRVLRLVEDGQRHREAVLGKRVALARVRCRARRLPRRGSAHDSPESGFSPMLLPTTADRNHGGSTSLPGTEFDYGHPITAQIGAPLVGADGRHQHGRGSARNGSYGARRCRRVPCLSKLRPRRLARPRILDRRRRVRAGGSRPARVVTAGHGLRGSADPGVAPAVPAAAPWCLGARGLRAVVVVSARAPRRRQQFLQV